MATNKRPRKAYKRIGFEDRKKIEALNAQGKTVDEMAMAIGVHSATMYRELARGGEPYKAGIRNHKANQNIAKLVSNIEHTNTSPYADLAGIREPTSIINRPLVHGNTEVGATLININHFIRSFQILSPEFYRRKFIAVFQKGTISHVAHRSRPTGESVQCYGTPDKTSCSATHHLTLSLQRRKQNQRVAIGNR